MNSSCINIGVGKTNWLNIYLKSIVREDNLKRLWKLIIDIVNGIIVIFIGMKWWAMNAGNKIFSQSKMVVFLTFECPFEPFLITLLMIVHSSILIQFLIFLSLTTCLLNDTASPLLSNHYEGTWKTIMTNNQNQELEAPWNWMEIESGNVLVYFEESQYGSGVIEYLILEFLLPKYYDEKMIKIKLSLKDNFKSEDNRWQGSLKGNYSYIDKTEVVGNGIVPIEFIVDQDFIGLESGKFFSLIISYKPTYMSPTTSLFFAILAFTVLIITRRKDKIEETNIRHQTSCIILAVVMVLLIAASEIVIGFRSLFGTMSPEAFFTVSGFINFAIFYQVTKFYGKLAFNKNIEMILAWVLTCFYTWFLLYFRHNKICLILNSLVFVPEIVYHCRRGQKIKGDLRFVLLVISNQMYVIYFKSCPTNLFKESPSYSLGMIIMILLFTQITIIAGQIAYGPRFFIPLFFLPHQHNYFDAKEIKVAMKLGGECYICLEDIKEGRKVMITPCHHIFHKDCIYKWMEVQMKCPIDRSDLPAL